MYLLANLNIKNPFGSIFAHINIMMKFTKATAFTLLFFIGLQLFAQAQPDVRTMPQVPLMRQLYHDKIDKQQTALEKVSGNNKATIKNAVDNIQIDIELNASLDNNNKIKYLRGIEDVLTSFNSYYKLKAVKAEEGITAIDAYKEAMQLERFNQSILPVIEKNTIEISNIIIDAFPFTNNEGVAASKYILVYKSLKRTPDKALVILTKYPEAPFADSIISWYAYNKPDELYDYVPVGNGLSKKIASNKDPKVAAIVRMAKSSQGRLYYPFLDDITAGRITYDAIDSALANMENPNDDAFYKLLVKTQINNAERMKKGDTSTSAKNIEARLQIEANERYIKVINELHNSPDNVRFKRLQNLTPQELYYLAIFGDETMYTSSYVRGIYKYTFDKMKVKSSDILLNSVHENHFKKWIRIAAAYNTLNDFLGKMDTTTRRDLIIRFANGLDKSATLEDAVDVADTYSSIDNTYLQNLILKQVQTNLAQSSGNSRKTTIYRILNTIFLSRDPKNKVDVSKELGIEPIYRIPLTALKDSTGRIFVQQYFYGDKDGKGTFASFRKHFENDKWKITDKKDWVEVSSRKGTPVTLFYNRPFDETEDLDLKAQATLNDFLFENNINPTVIIHRGHSYYAKSTIRQLFPSARVVMLGSCGGYSNIHDVLSLAEKAHIISSKQTGYGAINIVVIKEIMETLRSGKDIDWPAMWSKLESSLPKTEFADYVPPYKNLGAIFITAYDKAVGLEKEKDGITDTASN